MAIGRIVDLSDNQIHPVNWPLLARAGVSAVIVKATEGTTYFNPYYESDMAGAAKAGLQTLAYHYASFGNVDAEVEWFVNHAQDKARVLDLEGSTNVPWARAFLMGLHAPADRVLTYGQLSSIAGIRAQIPSLIWVGAYQQSYPGFGVMWQHTETGELPGIRGYVDISNWYGTELQYETLFGIYDPPPVVLSQPKKKVPTMYLTQQGNAWWLCSGDTAIHVVDPADLVIYNNAGVPTIGISAAQFALYTQVG